MGSDSARVSGEGFTSISAARVMAAACRIVGLASEGAELIRFGENALYRLAAVPVVVRVGRGVDYLPTVRKELAVSRWLEREGFPAARAVGDVEQPLVVDGRPVTFWNLIEDGGRTATYGELGAALRELSSLVPPESLALPAYDVFGRVDARIESASGISEDDREFLRKRRRELTDRLTDLSFQSTKGPVHGDAHTDNLMVDRDGRVHLIDLENFCIDHPEWDLVVCAHEYDRLGWVTSEDYGAFVREYGRDLREWQGFGVLSAVQEFRMTTWLMQNVAEGAQIAEEVKRRIASLRDDDAPRRWQAY